MTDGHISFTEHLDNEEHSPFGRTPNELPCCDFCNEELNVDYPYCPCDKAEIEFQRLLTTLKN